VKQPKCSLSEHQLVCISRLTDLNAVQLHAFLKAASIGKCPSAAAVQRVKNGSEKKGLMDEIAGPSRVQGVLRNIKATMGATVEMELRASFYPEGPVFGRPSFLAFATKEVPHKATSRIEELQRDNNSPDLVPRGYS
jgi:hypothetical protein